MSRLERDRPDSLGVQEMLRIMDVATTLRLDRELIEEEPNVGELKARLKERMLAASKVTGESVTPEEVDAAIAQYYAGLHAFREPKLSLPVAVAHAWVRRWEILAKLGVLLAGAVVVWWLFDSHEAPLTASGRTNRQIRLLSNDIAKRAQVVQSLARDPKVAPEVITLNREFYAYLNKDDLNGITLIRNNLAWMETTLNEEYTVSVVPGTNRKSAFPRSYQGRPPAYYLIVEALSPAGKPLKRRIRNDEDGSYKEVTTWAERVPEAVYNRLKKDKLDDGVLNETAFAVKRRGSLEEEITMPGPDGKPLTRMGQLNQW